MKIKKVETLEEMRKVYELCYEAYADEGLCDKDPCEVYIHYPKLDASKDTIIFFAEEDGETIGTNSLTIDRTCGLHVDDTFKAEADIIREECKLNNKKLASSWRIATKPKYHSTRKVVFALIQATINEAIMQKIDICLFMFHPRHENFYKRFVSLETIAGPKECPSVKNALAILMRGDAHAVFNCKIAQGTK